MVDPDMEFLVIDNGSGFTKCGFAGDEAPKSIFPSVVGRPTHPFMGVCMDQKDCFVGKEALEEPQSLRLKYPIEHGMVGNWNDMEKIWHHTFYNVLRVTPEEHPVLLTEIPTNLKNNREKLTSIMFETFNVPAMYVGIQGVLSLFSSGRSTGVVIESGFGVTHVIPVYEGCALHHACSGLNVGGSDITDHLIKILSERGIEFEGSREGRGVAIDIKEKMCFVSSDYERDGEKSADQFIKDYELPDKSKIAIGNERFRAPEVLFSPFAVGHHFFGIHELTVSCIRKCEPDLRKYLFQNIVLSGGSTLFDGIGERLGKEIEEMVSVVTRIEIHSPKERKIGAWLGGSILASLSSMADMWITKDEYDDCGATIIHRKCFTGGGVSYGTKIYYGEGSEDKNESMDRIMYSCETINPFSLRVGELKFSLSKCFFHL